MRGGVMRIEDDPLMQRAEKAVAEAARLRQALMHFENEVWQQAQQMLRIEAELDPLLPHPPDGLGRLREVMAQDPSEEEQEPAHVGQSRPG
ncbi:hypothetical protein [Microvirga rosea]|uniref:hypothetical protein n=1 Tax=Microvirga rosea TaxID=2715425 RepID=UPI001D0B81CE|nr:hypothetical protein [Microvirga rosea]MCB8822867.1 hypothetical protein [Microvirga rosea]